MIPLAMVGVGGYGRELLAALDGVAERLGLKLVAAADTRLAELGAAAEALRRRGVRLYDDALAMFRALRGRCEAVYIASSIPTHAALTIAAAGCGFHVHLEKPPAATVQEVDAMLSALDAAGRMCLVGFQALHGEMRLILDAVASGRLGRVERLTCTAGWPRTRSYYRRNEWAGRLRCGDAWVLDGPATNALAHQLAHMLAMAAGRPGALAEPQAVRAELYAAGPVESHNLAAMEVRTAGGPVVRFYCTHASRENFGPVIELEATGGRATYVHGKYSSIRPAGEAEERRPFDSGRAGMIENFIEAVRAGDASLLRCPLAEARKYVVALDAAHESSGRIHRIAAGHWHLESEGTDRERVVVDGIDERIRRAAAEGALLADLPDAPPWAAAGEWFDPAGCDHFPRRFRCD